MKHLGIEVPVTHVPELDPGFLPLGKFFTAFLKDAKKPLDLAVERAGGEVAVYKTFIHGTPDMAEADRYYVDRLIKTMLWYMGGFKVYISGDKEIFEAMKATYCVGGKRSFDADFMSNVYEKPFEVVYCDQVPAEKSNPQAVGRHLGGCRIGFDAGGSDRKVSAVIDGEPVFSEEVVWYPKVTADPDYHYEGIVSALKSAAQHMPRVDAVGVSSAGIYIENRTMVASLFLKVPKEDFDAKVKDIYIRAIKDTFGDVPYVVANDGDVSALAGAMSLEENNIMGIAMGTSEAVGYVDQNGNITGWLNELAFAPVDVSPSAMEDEWSPRTPSSSWPPPPASTCPRTSPPPRSSRRSRSSWRSPAPPPRPFTAPSACIWATPWPCTTTSTASSTCCSWAGSCPAGAATSSWTCASRSWPTSTPRWQARSTPPCPTRRPAGWARAWPPPLCPS